MNLYKNKFLIFVDMNVTSCIFRSWSFVHNISPKYSLFYNCRNNVLIPEESYQSNFKQIFKKIKNAQ